jgi:hypothetical protein
MNDRISACFVLPNLEVFQKTIPLLHSLFGYAVTVEYGFLSEVPAAFHPVIAPYILLALFLGLFDLDQSEVDIL